LAGVISDFPLLGEKLNQFRKLIFTPWRRLKLAQEREGGGGEVVDSRVSQGARWGGGWFLHDALDGAFLHF